ncbi:hypothetical protein VNO80_13564 [Phaseolus coccineus]|uniref:Uncharacterized protein n=1 Tax=Phaseolus coccineus TaxID=3886 RepID=A0AAN9RA34_PHACN
MCGGATVFSGHQFFGLLHTTHPYPPINSVTVSSCGILSNGGANRFSLVSRDLFGMVGQATVFGQHMLIYDFSFAVIGMPLKYAQRMPACFTYSDAQSLMEKCATPILRQVKSDFTRYWYGDE